MIAYYDNQGRYVWVGTPTVIVDDAPPPPPHVLHATHQCYEGFVSQLSQYHDVVNNAPVDMPARPAATAVFNYVSKTWTDPRTTATQWPIVRAERDGKLAASDWVVARAMETGQAVPVLWHIYRQALRDVPLQADPFNIVWPVAP